MNQIWLYNGKLIPVYNSNSKQSSTYQVISFAFTRQATVFEMVPSPGQPNLGQIKVVIDIDTEDIDMFIKGSSGVGKSNDVKCQWLG